MVVSRRKIVKIDAKSSGVRLPDEWLKKHNLKNGAFLTVFYSSGHRGHIRFWPTEKTKGGEINGSVEVPKNKKTH